MNEIKEKLISLSKSKFRSSFHLRKVEKDYINEKGMLTIQEHANSFISKRLVPKDIINDGKQTPMKGHPVFIAQHATATCCRECLYKWHKIEKDKKLTASEIDYIIEIIMKWIEEEISR